MKKAKPITSTTAAVPKHPTLDCKIENNHPITVGDKVSVICSLPEVVLPSDKELVVDVSGLQMHEFAILSVPQIVSTGIKFDVTSYKVGENSLALLRLKAGDKIFDVSGDTLKVETVLPPKQESDTQQAEGTQQPEPTPYDIIAPQNIPYPLWWWILCSLVAAIVLGVVGRLVYRYLKNRKMRGLVATEIVLSPRERYLKALRALDSKGFHRQGQYKSFALELTTVFKRGLDEAFKAKLDELTTEETLEYLRKKQKKFYAETEREVNIILSELDKIKFAKIEVKGEDCTRLLDLAMSLEMRMFGAPEPMGGPK